MNRDLLIRQDTPGYRPDLFKYVPDGYVMHVDEAAAYVEPNHLDDPETEIVMEMVIKRGQWAFAVRRTLHAGLVDMLVHPVFDESQQELDTQLRDIAQALTLELNKLAKRPVSQMDAAYTEIDEERTRARYTDESTEAPVP